MYFEKEMNTNYCTLESSAMCPEERDRTLSKEIVRRMFRCDKTRTIEERVDIINKFTDKLSISRYSVNQSRKIVVSGIRCYKRKVQETIDHGLPVNRQVRCPTKRLKRLIKHKTDKHMWFMRGFGS